MQKRCYVHKSALKSFMKFLGKQSRSLFFNRVAGQRSEILLRKELGKWCFSCEFCETSMENFFIAHLQTAASVHSSTPIAEA